MSRTSLPSFAELAVSYVKIVDRDLTHFGHDRFRLIGAGRLDCAKKWRIAESLFWRIFAAAYRQAKN
jgi:hypothetical protein